MGFYLWPIVRSLLRSITHSVSSKLSFLVMLRRVRIHRMAFSLDSVLHLHDQQTLLSQQDFIDESEDCQPKHRCDIDSEGRRNASLYESQQGFRGPGYDRPGKLIEIGFWIPGCDHAAQHSKGL